MAEPKNPKASEAAKAREARLGEMTEQEKAAARDLKEARIEEIVKIMRPFAINGKLTWTRDVRLDLGALWGLSDAEVRRLSAEASKRIREDVDDPDELRRSAGEVILDQLAVAHSKNNVKDIALLAALVIKMADGPGQRIDISVETKQPTPSDAAQAVKEMFGVRVSNDKELTESEPTDSDPKGPAEE